MCSEFLGTDDDAVMPFCKPKKSKFCKAYLLCANLKSESDSTVVSDAPGSLQKNRVAGIQELYFYFAIQNLK